MKQSDKSYLNVKFSLIMAFVIQILANQIDNSTVKWILAITAIIEVLSAVFELISMVRWQKAEEKVSNEIAEKIKEMRDEFDKCFDTLNIKLDEAEKEEKAKPKRKTTKKKANNDCSDGKQQD